MTIHDRIEKLSGSRVFLHDAFFAEALKYEGVLAEVIETITGRKLEVAKIQIQETVDNRPYHSVRLDSTCYEKNGAIWNVEIENWSSEELMRRMRFYGDVLTARNFQPKRSYKEVPNVCVIFIASFDYFGLGRALYVPTRCLCPLSEEERVENERIADFIATKLDNGRYEYIVNASAHDNSMITKLVEELVSQEIVYEGLFPNVIKMKDALLRTPEGEEKMILCMNAYEQKLSDDGYARGHKDGREEGREEGRKEGRKEGREEGARLVEMKMSALKAQLLSEGKSDVFMRAVDDKEYRDQLFKYYFPNGLPLQDEE